MQNERYLAGWRTAATRSLGKIFNIDAERVYGNSISVLSDDPYGNTYGIADYPNFKYNGYRWTEVGPVIVVYKINESKRQVSIEAVFPSNTGFALKVFYKEHDPD